MLFALIWIDIFKTLASEIQVNAADDTNSGDQKDKNTVVEQSQSTVRLKEYVESYLSNFALRSINWLRHPSRFRRILYCQVYHPQMPLPRFQTFAHIECPVPVTCKHILYSPAVSCLLAVIQSYEEWYVQGILLYGFAIQASDCVSLMRFWTNAAF